MANTNDNISKLHQALKAKGYNDIGSEDEFRTFVSNDSNVKALHQSLKAAGYNDLGSEDEFGKWLKMGGEAATQTPEQNSPQQSGQGQAVVKSPTEGSGVVPGSRDNVAAYEEGQTADGSLSGGSNGSEVPEVGKDTADVIKPQKVEPRQEPQEVAAPKYGSSEYLTETIGGDGSDGNPYAGMSRQEALNNVGRKFYSEWYGKPDAYSKIREEMASYGITDVKDYSRAVADIRNSYIVPTAKRRINQLMSQFDKADERDLERIRAVLDSRETQQAIEQDLKNLGFADTEDAYAKDDLEGRAAARQQWQMVKDSYYKTLEKQLENLAADKYNYLPTSDARSHARQFARDLLGGGSEQHDERIKNREAFDMTTKYVSPQVGKYFSEAEQNAKNAFATYQAVTGGQSLPGMKGLFHQVIWNKHTDPEKIWASMEPNLKRIGESVVGNPDFMREAEAHADEEGVELADYMEHRVLPVFEASIQHEFERMAVEQEMPENFLGYAAAKMRESLVGTLLNAAFTSQARRRAQQRAMQLTDEGQGIYKPSIGARIGGGVAGMLPDLPLFGIVGKVAAPVGTGVVQTLSESGVRPLVSRLGGASISGALTMGGVESGKGFFEGLLNDNEYENLGEAGDRSFLDALGDAVKTSVQRGVPSFVSGLTMIGGPLGQRISNGRGIIGNLLGWGTQTGVDAAGATGMSVAMGDIKPEDAGEHFAENLGTFAALGLQHKAKEFKALADGGRSWNGVDFSKAEIRTLEEFGLGKLRKQLSSIEQAKNGGGLVELSMLGVDAPKSQVEAAKSEGAKLYNDIMHSYGIPRELKLKVAQAMGAPIPYYAIKPDVLDLSAQVPAASVDLVLIDVLNYEYNFGIAEKLKNGMRLDDYELTVRLLFQDNKAFNAAMEKQQRGERLTNAEQELVDTNMERFATVQREYFRREHERINSEFEKEHGLEAGTIDRMMDDVAKGKAVDNDTMKSYEDYLRDLDRQLSDLKAERDGLKEAAKEEPDTGAREEGEPAGETAGTVVEEPVVAEEEPIANGERQEGGVPKDDNNNQNEIAGTNEGTPPPLVMDDNGEVAWEQSPVEATIAGLSARVGRDRVGQIVDEELNGLTEEITKISERKVSGMNERLKREAEIEALAERMVYWQQVKDAITPKEEGEKPEEPAGAPAGEAAGTVAVAENVGDLDNAGGEAGFETGTGANEPPAAPTRPAGEAAGTVAGERPVAPTAPVGEAAGTGATGTVAEERPTAPTAPAGEAAGTGAGERPAAPVGPAGEAAGTATGIEEMLRKVHKFDKFKVGDVTLLDVLTEDEQRQVLDAYERGDKDAVGNLTGDLIQSHREDIILKGRDDRNSKVAKIMNGNGSREQKLRKVRELYKGYSDAEVALEDGMLVPTTLEEYISDLHSRVPKSGEGPLAYFSYERDGMKVVGMKDETGFGAKNGGDTDAFKPWLAPKGKGMSLQRYAEQIHSQLPEAMQEQFSDQDVRNAINEVFTSAERPSDITSMILKRGVQQAEQAVRRMEDGWIEDAHDYQKVSPADTSFAGRLEKAKQQTNAEPTEKQKEAGNYKKGHVSFGGYDYVVENPAGSIRRGRNTSTNETWEQKMNNTYGYILGKRGKDGDHLDMFINDDADLDSFDGKVYVIDQVNADGSFDEHKIMFGFDSEEAAREAYLSNYEEGWQGLGKITGVDKETFDKWLDSSDRKIKAFAEHSIAKNAEKGRRDDVAAYEEGRKEATAEAIDRDIRDQLIDIAREGGVQVSTDIAEGQKGIDDFYGEVSLSKGQKRARETASVSLDEEHQHAVISFADGAKVRNNLETLAENLEKVSNQRKNFIKEVAKSLGATSDGSNSEYATFETKNGRVVTIRLADHNATVSNFDYRDELDGISIVVTPMKNQGIINDGDAHIVEYYYDAIKLRRADGKPLSDIVRSIEQVMYSGEYNDKTGLAEREEVNVGAIRPQKANKLDVNGRPMLFKTPDGLAYGYTYRGKIYIDPRIATSETPIHEYSHLWAEMKRKSSPKEWNQIKDVLLKDKMVQPFIDKVKEEYPELVGEGKDDAFVEEVLTQFSGRHGAEKLREMAEKIKAEMGGDATASTIAEAAIRRVKSVLNEFWQSVAKMMGWKYTNTEEIADRILSDLLEGKSPRDELRKALESGRLRDVVVAGAFDGMNERLNEQKVSKEDKALTVPLNGKKRSAKEQRERAAFAERQWRRAHERAEESISKLNLTDSVTVVDSIDDLQNAEKLSARQKRSKGWYDPDTGKIVIVMGNHRSPDDVVRTILNEGVARHGLRKLFGENFNQFLDNVYDNADARIKGEIDGLSGKKYGGDVHKSTEEYLGRLAEDTDFDGAENKPWVRHWFNQVKSAFLDMLKLIGWKGFKEELTDNELRYILWRSYKNLSEPGSYRNVFRSSEDAKVKKNLGIDEGASEIRMGHVEDELPLTIMNHQDEIKIRERVKKMSLAEAKAAYERINAQMLDENGLNIEEHLEKYKADWYKEHGSNGIGKAIANGLQALTDKYGSGMMKLRWELQDRIDELGDAESVMEGQPMFQKVSKGDEKPVFVSNALKAVDVTPEMKASVMEGQPMFRRGNARVEKVNTQFNEDLEKLKKGELPSGHVFEMGMPSIPLLSTGIPYAPIRLHSNVLNTKMHDPVHTFTPDEIKDLVKHIQRPVAIFEYGDKEKAQNLMVGIHQATTPEGKQFLLGLALEPVVNGKKLEYNSVRNVFPKNFHDWIHWINQGKLLRVDDKKEIEAIIDALRTNPVDHAGNDNLVEVNGDALRINPVDYISAKDLNSAAKLLKDFENPKLSAEKLQELFPEYARAAEETGEMLGGVEVKQDEQIRFQKKRDEEVQKAYDNGTDVEYDARNGKKLTMRIHTPASEISGMPSTKIEPHTLSREEQKKMYQEFKPETNDTTGETVEFYNSAFGKNHREGGLFEKIVPQIRDLFKTSRLIYSEKEQLSGTPRKDGTTHKRHDDLAGFGNYLNRVTIDDKDYYVRFTVQRKKGESGLHSSFVSNVELYEKPAEVAYDPSSNGRRRLDFDRNENPTDAASNPSSNGGRMLDFDRISDAKLRTYFEKSKEISEKVAMTSQQTEQNSQKDAVDRLLDEVDRRRGIKLQRVSGESGPEPEMTPEERQYWNQWQSAMSKWKARNGLNQDAQEPVGVPRKEADESAVDYAKRVMQYSREKALWKTAPQLDDYRQSREDKMVSDAAHQAEVYHGDLFMNESTARARRIAADLTRIRHAMSRQKAYDKATVKAVTDFAQDFMRMGFGDNLTRGEIERMLSSVKNAAGAPSVKKEVDKVLNILMDSYLRDLENRLVKLSSVKELKQTAQGVEAQGKLELKGQRMIQAFREARQGRWTVERLRERLGEIAENMSRDDEEAPMWEQDFEGVSLALQYAENIDASRQEWEDLRQEYKDAIRNYGSSGRSYQAQQQLLESLEKSMQENKMERIGMYGDIIGRLEGNIGESMQGAKEFVEREREHVKLIHSMANFDLAGMDMGAMRDKKMSERFNGNGARFFLGPLATFEQLLKQFGSRASNGEGYLYDYYMRNWMDSVNRAFENEERAKEELDAKAREVFGSKVKRWSDLYDIVRKLPTAEVSVVDQGETKNFELTQGNLLYIYMANKMTDGAMKLRNMGITEEQVEQIKDFLDPRLVELGDWLQEEYLPSKRAEYNKVHERMFGAPMAAIDHYFPIKILGDARQQDTDVANMANADDVLPSTITGSIIKRRRNALPLDILHTDALSLAIEHIEDMEHWAAQAEWNKDVNTLLSYTTFRNKVKNMQTIYGSGDQLWNTLQDAARMAAGTYRPKVKPGSVDKTVTNIAKGVTAAKISFRAYTAFKQILSAPAFLHDVDMGDFVKYSANPYGSWKWAMENMPVFRKRWKSRQAGDTRLQETESDWELWKNDVVQLASRWGMSPNALVDGVTCAVGARAIYETRLRRYLKQGMDEEKAKKRALQDAEIGYNLTQQSSEGAFVSQIQKDRTLAANMLSVFRNSSMSYTRQWVDAARNLKHRARKGYKEDSIDFMARLYQDRLDMDEAQARSAAEWQYARSGRRNVACLLNMMFGVTVAWNLGASLPYLLIGDDDDTKKDMLTDALMKGLIAGPTEGLAGGNLISDFVGRTIANKDTRKAFAEEGIGGAFDTALKGGGDFEINPLPLMADIESMIGKLGYDRYAALQDVFNICVQSSVGVNPQTFTDMFNAVMDYAAPGWDGTSYTWQPENMLKAKELALFMMRLANAPTSSWRGKYIDELGTDVTIDEAKHMPYDELANRYAHYKHWKDAPFAGWLRGEEGRKEKMDKLKKQFEKAVLDRIGGLSDRSLEDLSLQHHGDSAFQATTAKELKKRLEGMSDEDLRYMYDNFFSNGDRVVPSKERQMAEKEAARRSDSKDYFLDNRNKGGNDDKGKAKKWAKNFYVTMRDWTDLEEDLELEKIRREAKAAGDDRKAETVEKAYKKMNEWIYDLGSGERRRANGTVVDEDYRWREIRKIRKETLEKLK